MTPQSRLCFTASDIADGSHTHPIRGCVSLTEAAKKCKDDKRTEVLSRSSSNHRLTAGVKK